MKSRSTVSCISLHLENDSVFRINLPTCCRSVLFQRSICAVPPSSLPTDLWLDSNTLGYAGQKSLMVSRNLYSAGILLCNCSHVIVSRLPTEYPTTCLVLRFRAIQVHDLQDFSPMKLHTSSSSRISSERAGKSVCANVERLLAFF